MTFGERLICLRTEKGYSQKECAEKLGIEVPTYNRWERGNNRPDYGTLIKLADFFDVSTDYLVGFSDFRSPDPNKQAASAFIGLKDDALESIFSFTRNAENFNGNHYLNQFLGSKLFSSFFICFQEWITAKQALEVAFEKARKGFLALTSIEDVRDEIEQINVWDCVYKGHPLFNIGSVSPDYKKKREDFLIKERLLDKAFEEIKEDTYNNCVTKKV